MSYLHDIKRIQDAIETAEYRVIDVYRIKKEDIYKKSRSPEHSQARFAVWYLLVKFHQISAVAVGKHYRYDHTSVLHGVKRAIELNIPSELGLGAQPVENTV